MRFFIKEKSFYKQLLSIMVPIALQNLVGFGVSVTDTVMVGQLGDFALSGTYLGGQPFFLFMIISFGLSSGGAVLISQYWGQEDRGVVRRVMGISIRFVAVVSVLFATACFLFPAEILRLFSKEEAVIAEGARYLKWVALSYPLFGISSCYMNSLRAVEKVKFATAAYFVSFFVNLTVNYLLIFGNWGFPKLGVVGAAFGTVAARTTEFLIAFVYAAFAERDIKFRLSDLFRWEKELLPDYVRHSVPVICNEMLWSLGSLAQAAIIGNIGAVFASANSIASVVQQLANVALFGVGNASAVLIGKAVGAGRPDFARRMGKTILALAAGIGACSSLLMLALRSPVVEFYNVTPEAAAAAKEIMGIMALLMVPAAIEITSCIGVLRGGGDTKFAFVVDAGCMWLIGVPLGYLAGFVWKLPIVMVFLFMRMDVPVRISILMMRIMRGKFIRNVTREIPAD